MDQNKPVIMAVGAHHDDNELLAGTLARHQQAGWNIVSVVMTNGRFSLQQVSDQVIAIRDAESRAAAELLGMECVFLKLREGCVQPTDESRTALVSVMRQYRPEIVITHPPQDYHLDHMNTSKAVLDAVYSCDSPGFPCPLPRCPGPKLYYCDAWFMPFQPDEYIDITDLIDLKLDMLRCHQSQLPEDGPQPDDMIDLARQQSRTRGLEIGVGYAEAFRLVPRLQCQRVSKLLGG